MVKFIALLTAGSALFVMVPAAQSSWSKIMGLVHGQFASDYWLSLGYSLTLEALVPLLKLIAAFGLYRLSTWGRKFTVRTIFLEVALRLFIVGKFFYHNYYYVKNNPGETVIAAINVAPTAVIVAIGVLCLLYLTRPGVKMLDVELTPGARHRSFR